MPVIGFGCGQCIDIWSTIKNPETSSWLIICCRIFRNVIDRNAKVELQLGACYRDYPAEPPFDDNGDKLLTVRAPF